MGAGRVLFEVFEVTECRMRGIWVCELAGDCGAPQRLLDALGQFHLSKRQCREVTRPTGAGPREQNQVGMGIGAACYWLSPDWAGIGWRLFQLRTIPTSLSSVAVAGPLVGILISVNWLEGFLKVFFCAEVLLLFDCIFL